MATTARVEDGRIAVRSQYHLRAICKQIPGRMWMGARKMWTYPATSTAAANIAAAFENFGGCAVDSAFEQLLDVFDSRHTILTTRGVTKRALAARSKTKPMKHQILGTQLVGQSDGCMLLWEMGTGKTKAVIDAICHYAISRTLVVCPLNVIGQWQREIKKHAAKPCIVLALSGRMKVADKAKQLIAALEAAGDAHQLVVLINYEAVWRPPLGPRYQQLAGKRRVRLEAGIFLAYHWGLIVCDESHRIKDPRGRASVFMGELATRAAIRVGLTGTPMPRDPLDLWAQMRFVDAGVFGSAYGRFRATYATLGGFQGKQVVAFKNLPALNDRLYAVAHRVTKDEVLDLPSQSHVERPIMLSPKAWRHYIQLEEQLVVEVKAGRIDVSNALVELLRLQQLTSGFLSIETGTDDSGRPQRIEQDVDTAKRDALAEILTDLPDNEPLVVFCRFLHDLRAIAEVTEDLDFPRDYFEISGATKQRDEWETACAKGRGAVLGVQIRAGGLGVDLTHAAFAVFYSIGFEWGDFEQALARLHRHGQTRKVTYIHLIATNTVDEAVYGAMTRKEHVVRAVLDRLGYDRSRDAKA